MVVLNWDLTPVSLPQRRLDLFQNVFRADGDRRTGAVNTLYTSCIKHLVILLRNDTTHKNNNIVAALLLELGNDGGYQRFVTSSKRGNGYRMHVIFNRLARALLGRLEQGSN